MCKYWSEYEEGYSGYAHCELTGDTCWNLYDDSTTRCPAIVHTDWPCPVCAPEDLADAILKHDERDDTYLCPYCEKRYTLSDLPGEYSRGFQGLIADYNKLFDAQQELEAKMKMLAKRHRELIENISAAIDAAKQEAAD